MPAPRRPSRHCKQASLCRPSWITFMLALSRGASRTCPPRLQHHLLAHAHIRLHEAKTRVWNSAGAAPVGDGNLAPDQQGLRVLGTPLGVRMSPKTSSGRRQRQVAAASSSGRRRRRKSRTRMSRGVQTKPAAVGRAMTTRDAKQSAWDYRNAAQRAPRAPRKVSAAGSSTARDAARSHPRPSAGRSLQPHRQQRVAAPAPDVHKVAARVCPAACKARGLRSGQAGEPRRARSTAPSRHLGEPWWVGIPPMKQSRQRNQRKRAPRRCGAPGPHGGQRVAHAGLRRPAALQAQGPT